VASLMQVSTRAKKAMAMIIHRAPMRLFTWTRPA
jgi:hypothetical protein